MRKQVIHYFQSRGCFYLETHRTVLNQILRQSNNPLSDGPFAVLVNHTRLLDFDVKRRYFRQELEKQDKVSNHLTFENVSCKGSSPNFLSKIKRI